MTFASYPGGVPLPNPIITLGGDAIPAAGHELRVNLTGTAGSTEGIYFGRPDNFGEIRSVADQGGTLTVQTGGTLGISANVGSFVKAASVNTPGASPYALQRFQDLGRVQYTVLTNGIINLPDLAATPGLGFGDEYYFVVTSGGGANAATLQCLGAGDTIVDGANVSVPGGKIVGAVLGLGQTATLHLFAGSNNDYIVMSKTGTWTVT